MKIPASPYPNGISYFSDQALFEAESWTIPLDSTHNLILSVVSEEFEVLGRVLALERINVNVVRTADGAFIQCPNIVGLWNELVSIESINPDLQGKHITFATAGDWKVVVNG